MSWVDKVSPQNAANGKAEPSPAAETPATKPTKGQKRLAAAVDFAYTLNHALVCTATDPITDVPIGVAVQRMLDKSVSGDDRASLKDFTPKNIIGKLKGTFSDKAALLQWSAGEVGGDFGAVPAVVAIRQFAPGAIDALRKVLSPVATPVFRRSSTRSARKEFAAQGLDPNSDECKARAKEIFDAEMQHLPNAALWTVLSPTINIAVQKKLLPEKWRNDAPTSHLLAGKIIGSTVTSSLTVGLRNLSPNTAQKWDDTVTEKVAMPVINVVSRMFGVNKEELQAGVEEMHRQQAGRASGISQAGHSGWETRLAKEASSKDQGAGVSL